MERPTVSGVEDFADFYSHGYRRLVAELALLVGSRAEAEDIAQDAFARAWSHWTRLQRFDQPQAWVRRVAYNAAIDRLRAHRRFLGLRHKLAEPEAGPGLSVDWLDLQARLKALSPQQRAALILTAVAGLTSDEAARELDVSANTVRSWLHRARTALDGQSATSTPEATGGN